VEAPSQGREPWTRGEVTFAAVVAVGVAVARLAHLERAPAEWYGDISTVYEAVGQIRNGDRSPGYYTVGLGDLYPALLVPFLAVLGDSYLAIKTSAAIIGFVGLALLGLFTARLVDRRCAIATVAIAGTSSWWLIASRLGDVQALTPTLTLAAVVTGHAAIRSRDELLRPICCGVLCALGVYTYGNTMVLPIIGGLLFVVAWRLDRATWRSPLVFAAAVGVTLVPFLVEMVTNTDAVLDGHVGRRMPPAGDLIPTLWQGTGLTIRSYVTAGDPGFRANPTGVPHVDGISLVLGVTGIVHWLRRERRLTGLFLVGTFGLLHLPAILAGVDTLPSASRTTAAAPFAALFVGTGVWVIGRSMARFGPAIATAAMAWTVTVVAVVNLVVYQSSYLPGLPVRNVPVSSMLVDLVDEQPPGTVVHMVGEGWLERGVPESKSVAYQVRDPDRLVRHTGLACSDLEAIDRPAVVVWTPTTVFPGVVDESCTVAIEQVEVVTGPDGRQLYRVGRLP
jgi:hypothetical protein